MKPHWLTFILVALLGALMLVGCTGEPAATPLPTTPSASPVPTEVAASPAPAQSPTPTVTLALPLTPTLTLPVLAGTPVTLPQEPITPDNVDQIQPLAVWGRGQINQIAYSPDGKFLVVGSTAGLWLYDAQSLELVHFILTNSEILALDFSADGLSLTAQVGGNTITRWDTHSWTEQGSWPVGVRELKEVAFSPDGATLVSALEDGQVGLWEIESGRLLKTFGVESHPPYLINALALSEDGKLLAAEGVGHTIRLWDIETGQLLQVLPGHSDTGANVVSLLFSPDGYLLVSAAANEIIRLWEVETGSQQREFTGGINLAFSPNGRFLAAGVSNQTISVWVVSSGQLQQRLSYSLEISSLAFAPDSTVLASGGETGVGLWTAEAGEPVGAITGYQVGYEDTWRLVTPSDSRGTQLIWHYEDQQVDLIDVKTNQVIYTLVGQPVPVGKVLVSLDNNLIVTQPTWLYEDILIRAWDGDTEQLLKTLDLGNLGSEELSLALSPNGRLLTTGFEIYDLQTGTELHRLVDDQNSLIGMHTPIFSSDGQKLAVGANNGSVTIWDVKTGALLHELAAPAHYFNGGIVFSPDDQVLAAGYPDELSGTIQVWRVETGENLYTLTGHPGQVTNIAFSPEGKLLLSSSRSNTPRPQDGGMIRLWEAQTGQLLRAIDTPSVIRAVFTPDGTMLVLEIWGSGTVQVWGLPPK